MNYSNNFLSCKWACTSYFSTFETFLRSPIKSYTLILLYNKWHMGVTKWNVIMLMELSCHLTQLVRVRSPVVSISWLRFFRGFPSTARYQEIWATFVPCYHMATICFLNHISSVYGWRWSLTITVVHGHRWIMTSLLTLSLAPVSTSPTLYHHWCCKSSNYIYHLHLYWVWCFLHRRNPVIPLWSHKWRLFHFHNLKARSPRSHLHTIPEDHRTSMLGCICHL